MAAGASGAHGVFPGLRFSLTLATLANNDGSNTARSLGSGYKTASIATATKSSLP
ncbi:MAG: hypothetical protein ACRENE_26145 [Polyangiaceae bacterium]